MVTLKLTDAEARIIYANADGWLDAGADGGLTQPEKDALRKLCDLIRKDLTSRGLRLL
ncbi:hypothetical protein ACOTF2_06985 [Achromobacter xylosoxidans]